MENALAEGGNGEEGIGRFRVSLSSLESLRRNISVSRGSGLTVAKVGKVGVDARDRPGVHNSVEASETEIGTPRTL